MDRLNLIGQKFGRLTVKDFAGIDKRGKTLFKCECDCGNPNYVIAMGSDLKSGATKSCGCLRTELGREQCKKMNKMNCLPYGEANFNRILKTYRYNAKSRNLPFELTREEFREIITQNCTYCNHEPSNISNDSEEGPFIYNGIDRVDSKLGYVSGNCVPSCFDCNRSKDNMSPSEFLDWIKSVYEHSILKIN